jgi:glucose-6-phosphate 1-dehydrogenase
MSMPYNFEPDHLLGSEESNKCSFKSETETFDNPFHEPEYGKPPEPCILVILGASGDLTGKKLIPALFNLMREGNLPTNFICVGVARRPKTVEEFREEMSSHIKKHSRATPEDSELYAFSEKLFYYQLEFQDDSAYDNLNLFLKDLDKSYGTRGNRVFYLSVQPTYFLPIIERLKSHSLIYDANHKHAFSRVIIEKPFGHDYDSAIALQKNLSQYLSESQIFRIDHYLGKETVQNLLVFRFGNSTFEALWNNRYVDNIQITVAENIGIEGRGAFYEGQGLTRDVIQNHLMQLLSLVAMEPPINLTPDAIRNEKVKVLQSLQPIAISDLDKFAVRGQYKEGYIDGDPVGAYRNELNVDANSNVETFAALRLQIENWRWAGVPIYVRAGKRLPKRSTEIAISFKKPPSILFHKNDHHNMPNQIIFRIQPNDGISIKFNTKIPGSAAIIQPVNMDFQYASYFGKEVPEAYERLIHDSILGDSTLFARVDESINSWRILTPVLEHWSNQPLNPDEFYSAGTFGPKIADDLPKLEGRKWKPV